VSHSDPDALPDQLRRHPEAQGQTIGPPADVAHDHEARRTHKGAKQIRRVSEKAGCTSSWITFRPALTHLEMHTTASDGFGRLTKAWSAHQYGEAGPENGDRCA
jgi:hypothetical protein